MRWTSSPSSFQTNEPSRSHWTASEGTDGRGSPATERSVVIAMPGLRTSVSLASVALTRMVRAAGSMRLSMALISPATVMPGSAAAEAVTSTRRPRSRLDDPLGHVEGDGRPRTIGDRGDRASELTRSPTETSLRPITPSKGALIVRLARSSSAILRSTSALWAAWRASLQAGPVTLPVFSSRSARSSASRAPSSAIQARSCATS